MRFRMAAAAAGLVVLAACANPSYDESSTRDELVDAGFTEEQATCVTDGMARRFAERRLDSRETASTREKEAFDEIVAECIGDE